jgi:hypothetical protein
MISAFCGSVLPDRFSHESVALHPLHTWRKRFRPPAAWELANVVGSAHLLHSNWSWLELESPSGVAGAASCDISAREGGARGGLRQ